ncbi:serine hydrolase domain-containing protein [Flammeovirga pacifica]|uniref:Beta-lactamase-related domain-containing protein n=1 Tax=Flammeovirga pacifica TaxID=915059 RepID=A0A1S1Z561_FLAPC|nr:serine hydrolase domain-containing protein [Flammeovirga pacifica]OHX68215.1 hypothetical protein NH26_18605 [Flammeovirga pacifica]
MRYLIFLFLFTNSIVFGQVNQKDINKYERFVNKLLNEGNKAPVTNIFYYLSNGEQVIQKGIGHITKGDEKVDKNSTFKIASQTKMFTAVVILQLMEEGKLKLDDKVYQYLHHLDYLQFDSLHLYQDESYGKEITVKQLLQHRSGLGDIFVDTYQEFIDYTKQHLQKQWTPEDLFEFYYSHQVNHKTHFQPDSSYYYTDVGYFLLGLTIENITKKPLAQNYRERIIDPLGMSSTYFEYHEENPSTHQQGHAFIGGWDVTADVNTSYDWAGGGLVSNTSDLSTFIHALFDLKLYKNQSTLEQMTEARSLGRTYGMGLTTFSFHNHMYYGHGGFWGSLMAYDPIRKRTIILSINQSEPAFNEMKLIKKSVLLVE